MAFNKLKKHGGFTLLEVLVVMILLSMVVTMLGEGITNVLGLRSRFLTQLALQRTSYLQERWFRQVCSALTPGMMNGANIFSGNHLSLHGLSMAPLNGYPGVPTPVSIDLERKNGSMILQYRERAGDLWQLGRWQAAAADGGLYYLDGKGNWQEQWPPVHGPAKQLPEAVMLWLPDSPAPAVWCADLPGRHLPKSTVQGLL